MVVTEIHLILQRKATEDEIASYAYLRRIFDTMTPDVRQARGIRRVTDLARDDSVPGKHVIHFKTSPEPLYNEIHIQTGRLQISIPGATEQLKRIVASMLARFARKFHRAYYVVGLLETGGHREIGFRTLIARTEIQVRHMGH